MQILEVVQIQFGKTGEAAHLGWQCEDIHIVRKIKCVKSVEGANAHGDLVEMVVGNVEVVDGWCIYIWREGPEFVV